MKSFHIFLTILFISNSDLNAQSVFTKSTIILQNDDTLKGYVQLSTLENNTSKIKFKRSLKGKAREISKPQIISLVSPYSQRQTHIISNKKIETLHPLSTHQKDTVINYSDTAFLDVLVEGKITLLMHRSMKEPDRFFIAQNESIQELEGHQLTSRGLLLTDYFKKQLTQSVPYCNDTKPKLKRLSFNENQLAAIIVNANKCNGGSRFVKDIKWRWRWNVIAGFTSTLMRYKRLDKPWHDFNWKSANFPTIGVSVYPYQNYKYRRFLFVGESLLQHQNTTTNVQFEENFNTSTGLAKFETINLKLNLIAQANLLKQVYFIAGISNSILLANTSNLLTINFTDVTGMPAVKESPSIKRDQRLGYDIYFLLGGGIKIGKASLEGRVDYSDGLSTNRFLLSNYRNIYFLIKYDL